MARMRWTLCALIFGTLIAYATRANANPMSGSPWTWRTYDTDVGPTAGSSSPSSVPSTSAPPTTSPPTGVIPTTAPGSATKSTSSGSPKVTTDAFINFGTAPFPESSSLTQGRAEPWYLNPVVERLFGGVPNAQQQAAFTSQVDKDIDQTFKLSGLSPVVTSAPNTPANHTISVVSNASYTPDPNALGITDVGKNGFAFIDKLKRAHTETELEWSLAHVISHELMHAFGVAVHHDRTGKFLDAAAATWAVLTNPKSVFSHAAVQDILAHDYGRSLPSGTPRKDTLDGDSAISAEPVPEPATCVLWASLGAFALRLRRRAA